MTSLHTRRTERQLLWSMLFRSLPPSLFAPSILSSLSTLGNVTRCLHRPILLLSPPSAAPHVLRPSGRDRSLSLSTSVNRKVSDPGELVGWRNHPSQFRILLKEGEAIPAPKRCPAAANPFG